VTAAGDRPTLTVVVATQNNERHLAECLSSLLSQSLRRLEVVVVDDGSTDSTVEVAQGFAAADPRLWIVAEPRRGVAAARNRGSSVARGTYLAFVDPDDTVPAKAFATMTKTLKQSGSDLVIGAVQQVGAARTSRPSWVSSVHDRDRIGVRLVDFPPAMQDTAGHNRVFRRAFYLQHVRAVAADDQYGDVLAGVTALIRAERFDVLHAVTYRQVLRGDPSSLVRERTDTTALVAHLSVLREIWQLLTGEAPPEVAEAWLVGLLDEQLSGYVEQAGRGDDSYRQALSEAAAHFLALADQLGVWSRVRVERKLRLWVAATGRWSEAALLVEYFRLNGAVPPTAVVDGQVRAVFPLLDDLGEVPARYRELSVAQTALSACLSRVSWNPDGTLAITGWAFIRGVDVTNEPPRITATLSAGDRVVPLVVHQHRDLAANRWANQLNQDFGEAGFATSVDIDRLASVRPTTSPYWQLQVTVAARGLVRSGPVRAQLRNGVAQRMLARDLTDENELIRWVPVMDEEQGFVVHERLERVRALTLSADGGHLRGELRVLTATPASLVAVRMASGPLQREAALSPTEEGAFSFTVELPVGGQARRPWTVRAIDQAGKEHRVSWPVEARVGRRVGGGPGSASWHRSTRGYCDVATDWSSVEVQACTIRDDAAHLDVALCGVSPQDLAAAVLRGPWTGTGAGEVREVEAGVHRLTFPMHTPRWGGPELPLPTGSYSPGLPDRKLVFAPSEALLAQLPHEGATRCHGYTLARVPGRNELSIQLRAPLEEGERGRLAQRRLGQRYAATGYEPEDAVLFQSYRGEFATDSQRALHEELLRRGTRLELRWGVSDYSVDLPEGAVPLLIGSAAWYDAVGTSRYLCQNIDFDRFFHRRAHQRYLQTFHGYPFKSMGVSLWRAQGRSEPVIEAECVRRNQAWDAILVPAPFCVDMYREEYRYDGEVLVTGYPRDDALVTGSSLATRDAVRTRLGIGLDQTVILYAPTWRDTIATGAWTAKLFDELDLNHLAGALGPSYTVLLRGHNYNMRAGSRASSAAVLDVSSYPEVNDLILAADVAVLDYSSLRFDWLLTEKPVVFFVPDLADYLSARKVLFDYASTAPGPLLSSTEQVVEALRDLDAASAEYAAARKDFNERYNRLQDGCAAARVVDAFFV